MHSHGSIREALSLAAARSDARAELRDAAVLQVVAAGESLRAAVRANLARVGLTVEGFQTLEALRQLDPAPACPTTIAGKTDTTKALLSHTLTRLEFSQLITRERDPNDRRVIWIRLTDEGRSLARRALAACQRCLADLTQDFSPAELRSLSALAQKLENSALRISRP